jgi:hypothetical protein
MLPPSSGQKDNVLDQKIREAIEKQLEQRGWPLLEPVMEARHPLSQRMQEASSTTVLTLIWPQGQHTVLYPL